MDFRSIKFQLIFHCHKVALIILLHYYILYYNSSHNAALLILAPIGFNCIKCNYYRLLGMLTVDIPLNRKAFEPNLELPLYKDTFCKHGHTKAG